MPLEKCEAIVVRRLYFQNSSLVVSFITPEFGLLESIAKGCRQAKSKLYGNLDYFNRGELVFYQKRSGALHIVSQFQPLQELNFIKQSLPAFAAASLFNELIATACRHDDTASHVFSLFTQALSALQQKISAGAVTTAFIMDFLRYLGFAPLFDACVSCGCKLQKGEKNFSALRGGLLCQSCANSTPKTKLSPDGLEILRFLFRSGFSGVRHLSLNDNQVADCLNVLLKLLEAQLERKLKSASFLQNILQQGRNKNVA